jgi:hypothetical protein
MEEKANRNEDRHGPFWEELHLKAKCDPELEKRLEAIKTGSARKSSGSATIGGFLTCRPNNALDFHTQFIFPLPLPGPV